jgi:hypothetical protein
MIPTAIVTAALVLTPCDTARSFALGAMAAVLPVVGDVEVREGSDRMLLEPLLSGSPCSGSLPPVVSVG